MKAASLAALLVVALAGCSEGDDGPGPDAPKPSSSPPPEGDNGVLYVEFQSDGPATLEVPFPSLDSCLTPQAWMAGHISATNATAHLRNATDGRTGHVVAISGQGHVTWSAQVELGSRCQPFRYDPWSVDPDPADGVLDVRLASGPVAHASVLARMCRDGGGSATLYDGEPGTSWSQLQGRTIPVTC